MTKGACLLAVFPQFCGSLPGTNLFPVFIGSICLKSSRKMESKRAATGPHPLHLRHWRQCYRFCRQKVMNVLQIQQDWLWAVVYILLVTIIWPMAVLIVSIPFGQFRFFINYIRKLGSKLGLVKAPESPAVSEPVHIAIFASGSGSNAQKIIDWFRKNPLVKIVLIVCNNPKAGVLDIARKEQIPVLLIEKDRFLTGDAYLHELIEKGPTLLHWQAFFGKSPAPSSMLTVII